jgi:hypothetical protein
MAGDRNTVYVAFSGGTGWLQRIIKWFSRSDVNHAFLVLWDEDFGGWVQLGADEGGWIQSPAETRLTLPVCRLYAPPPGIDLRVGLRDLRSVLGAGYDTGGLFGMAWVLLWKRLGRKVKNPLQDGRKWFCSEIVDVVCARSGWELGLDEHAIDPGAEEKAVKAHGGIGPLTLAAVISTPTAAAA